MEENNQNIGATNWSNAPVQRDVPNAMGALVLGIISLVCTVILWCCYGFIPGLISGVIGLILGVMAQKAYKENPALYTEKSYKNAKAGKIMSLISLILCVLLILVAIIFIIMGVALDVREHMN